MKRKSKILLSADSDVSLYEVIAEIEKNLNDLVDEFYDFNESNTYDEELFVRFLKKKYGKNSIKFLSVVGTYTSAHMKGQSDMIFDGNVDVSFKFKDIKWINF